jgi:hypothetical protein
MRPAPTSPAGVRRELIAELIERVATDAEFRRLFRVAPRAACDAIGVPFELVRHMLADGQASDGPSCHSSSANSPV